MFHLDQAIAEWRRQMQAAGIKTPVPLEELENHLRTEIEEGRTAGLGDEPAFQRAVRQLGNAAEIKVEFLKVQPTSQRKRLLPPLIILTALFGSVLGGAMVMPALGRWHQTGTLVIWPLLMGGTLALLAGGLALYCISQYRGMRGKKLISAGIIAAGGFYVVPLLQAFFMPHTDWTSWVFCGCLAGVSLLFFGQCFRLNRLPRAPIRR